MNASNALLNPLLLIEVLSDSTAARDRSPKFEACRSTGWRRKANAK